MARLATSKNGVAIRLTEERWFHITEHHDEVAGHSRAVLEAVEAPDFVAEGSQGELIAVKAVGGLHLVVVYREVDTRDGFIITAFFTRKAEAWERRRRAWPRPA